MPVQHVTLEEVRAALRQGGVAEGDVRSEKYHLDGVCLPNGAVIVNPAPSYVLAALHELLHRMRPRWRGKRIVRESERLLSEMKPDEVTRFYREYRRRARKLPKPLMIEPLPE